jgi:hypothetical protein
VRQLLYNLGKLHLGDGIGADAEAYEEATALGVWTVGHPPNDVRSASLSYNDERPASPALVRNLAIVTEGVDGLIAAPKDWVPPASLRGQGTWTTIGYAWKLARHIWIVRPDGSVVEEG